MLNTIKAKDLKIGDKIMGNKTITKIVHTFRFDKMDYTYTIHCTKEDCSPNHFAYDYSAESEIIATRP